MSGWSRDQGAQERERETVREAREQPRGEAPATGLFRGPAPSDPAGDLGATTTHEHHVSASLAAAEGEGGALTAQRPRAAPGRRDDHSLLLWPRAGGAARGAWGKLAAGKGVAGT